MFKLELDVCPGDDGEHCNVCHGANEMHRYCHYFASVLHLDDDEGHLVRCPQCIAAERTVAVEESAHQLVKCLKLFCESAAQNPNFIGALKALQVLAGKS